MWGGGVCCNAVPGGQPQCRLVEGTTQCSTADCSTSAGLGNPVPIKKLERSTRIPCCRAARVWRLKHPLDTTSGVGWSFIRFFLSVPFSVEILIILRSVEWPLISWCCWLDVQRRATRSSNPKGGCGMAQPNRGDYGSIGQLTLSLVSVLYQV